MTGIILAIAAVSGSSQDFSAIDRHALNAPEQVGETVESLASYLIEPARNDTEKIRALFRWITANINYDIHSLRSASLHFSDPNDVLKIRSAVCDGYSTLFEALGRAAGLRVIKISGFAKGYGYEIGDSVLRPPNHSWNAVWLNGKWQLLDATWGAGHIDESGRFIRAFDEFFFLTKPGELINTHFPENPQFQLINPPVTAEIFIGMPYLKPAFFKQRLGLNSHHLGTIECRGRTRILLENPLRAQLTARLIYNGKSLNESQLFIQNQGSNAVIHVMSPGQGSYVLRIFVRRPHDRGEFEWAMDYLLNCQPSPQNKPAFPTVFSSFSQADAYLFRPLSGTLIPNRSVQFELTVPEADTVVIIQDNQWVRMARNNNHFIKTVRVNPGELQIGALFPGKTRYEILLKYEVHD